MNKSKQTTVKIITKTAGSQLNHSDPSYHLTCSRVSNSCSTSDAMIQFVLLISLCLLVLSVDRADASGMDFADTVALILGLVIGTVGVLACLGRYARRLRAEQY
uniref:(northern house mosquito) hypothetical protein n=1 Tax=Culex pipiens TaxID=7175 RepID=A0A8D8F7P0_CULPI